ncbi:MAG: glycoside hydrolase, partial [Bryobacteraceae bacterium]
MTSNSIRPLLLFTLATLAGAQQFNSSLFKDLHWRNVGPFRGGRTRAAEGVPSQPNVFYMGQCNGGVWKSDDYGRTWTPIFDSQPTGSIGAIAVAPSDPNVVYVASGEGLQRPDLSVGNGIYKSSDAGQTWTHLGLRDGWQIPALAVDPRDPNHLFAAVLGHPYGANQERGLFASTDGGQTWHKSLYVDENTGASDIAMDPSNPDVLYASLWEARQGPWEFGNEYTGTHGGIFKSTDAGKTWRKLTQGLPDVSQAYVAIAPSDPRRLYATAAAGRAVSIYASDDAGENWHRATTDPRPAGRIGGGDLPVPRVDPKDPSTLYSTSTVTWRSTDSGQTWTGLKGAPGGDDYQNMWINPHNPDIILLVSDQGAVVSVNRGRTWSSWYNQPTAQLYHAVADNAFPYRVCAGQQESGSVCVSSRGNDGVITFREWHPVGVIEYGYVAPDPRDPDIVYGAGRGQVSKFYRATGEVEIVSPKPPAGQRYRADRTQPIIFSPVDPHLLFYAANVVFKTTDGGHTWQTISPDLTRPHPGIPASLGSMAAKDQGADKQRGVVYALAPSFHNVDTIWAGTDEGLIWVTLDGGQNWKDVTPPALTPWSKVTQLEASHFDDKSAYASVSRFRVDDLTPYIYRTHDGGQTWQLITTGLPNDASIDTVREDPVRKGLLFAGSETSVWASFDDGGHWQSLQLNLPHTAMRDLWIHASDLIVATHGRSFWILDDISPLRQIDEKAVESGAWLCHPAPAYRVRRDTNTDTPLPPDEPLAENPPDGAVVDYYLAQAPTGTVTLEILDARDKLFRRYSSTDPPEITEADLKTLSIPQLWVRPPRILPATAGLHRWVWDLHGPPPESLRHEYPIAAVPHDTPRLPQGPEALPGAYTVKLTVDGHTYTAPLTIKMDPRVKTPPADLQQQTGAQKMLARLMTRTTEAVREARSAQEQIDKLAHDATGPLAAHLAALDKKIKAALGAGGAFGPAPAEPGLMSVNAELSGLYGEIDSADVAPSPAQTAAGAKLGRDFPVVMDRWNKLKSSDIAAINRELKAAGMSPIQLSTKPTPDEES